ncbi:hypothetical protein ABZP36_010003 [Zizania latifolia]
MKTATVENQAWCDLACRNETIAAPCSTTSSTPRLITSSSVPRHHPSSRAPTASRSLDALAFLRAPLPPRLCLADAPAGFLAHLGLSLACDRRPTYSRTTVFTSIPLNTFHQMAKPSQILLHATPYAQLACFASKAESTSPLNQIGLD